MSLVTTSKVYKLNNGKSVTRAKFSTVRVTVLGPVVRRVDNAIHWINGYPVDKCWQYKLRYPLDSDLSGG